MKIYQITSIVFLFMLLSAAADKPQNNSQTIDKKAFAEKIKNTKNPQIVDVRTPEEFKEGHIQNAMNIDWLGEHFVEYTEKLDKNKAVFVYCRSGKRSKSAADKLQEMGFKNIYNLDGGYLSWSAEELKTNKN